MKQTNYIQHRLSFVTNLEKGSDIEMTEKYREGDLMLIVIFSAFMVCQCFKKKVENKHLMWT